MQPKHKFINFGLLVSATVPLAIALSICGRMLYIIWPDLTPEQQWPMALGLVLISLPGAFGAIAAIFFLKKLQPVPKSRLVGLTIFLLFCSYVFFYLVEPHIFMRTWLFDHDAYLTILIAGLIPYFYYLLFYLASVFAITTPRGLVISIVTTILLPIAVYIGFYILRFLPRIGSSGHFLQILALTLATAFSFFLLRLLVYILIRKADALQRPQVLWGLQLIFVGLLPFLGLSLNAYGPFARESQGALGNFTGYTFWIIAGLNTVLYLIPQTRFYRLNLFLFGLRAAGFIFVLYFCTVFILFLPLALLLIAALGLGLLLLIPYLAAAVQILRLRHDFTYLATSRDRKALLVVLISGLLLLPSIVLGNIYIDRARLTAAIRFLEHPPLELNQDSRIHAKTILNIADLTPPERQRGLFGGERSIPIYHALYRQIVLDGADIAESLRKKIRLVFDGQNEFIAPARSIMPLAKLGEVSTAAKIDGIMTRSTLRVKVINSSTNRDAEFNTRIALPDGAFISGHYLTIDGVEVPAQITAKNTAIYVYNRVTETRRDPSLIYYEGKNALRWRIFPVPVRGHREAWLEITHAHDIVVTIAGREFALKALNSTAAVVASTSGKTRLLQAADSDTAIRRKPYVHFVLDCSRFAKPDYQKDAETAATFLKLNLSSAKISYVNSSIHTNDVRSGGNFKCSESKEGFFSEMALRAIIYSQFAAPAEIFPLIVVLSANHVFVPADALSYLTAFYGDANGFLISDGKAIAAYDFSGNKLTGSRPLFPLPVRLAYGKYFTANATLAFLDNPSPITAKSWKTALDGIEFYYDYYLGKSDNRTEAVISSVNTGVLNPATGSIVLETEAQRRKLTDLHKKMLNARNQLDTGEQPRMSEPWTFILISVLVLFLLAWRYSREYHARAEF